MTRIRLSRKGRRNSPFFHILVIDQKSKANGAYIEKLGFYDPLKKTTNRAEKVTLNKERYNHWLKLGAQPSETIAKLAKIV